MNFTIKRALLSVTDKSSLLEFASFLVSNGVELVSTGGTAKSIKDAGLPVTQVAELTSFPEILGGRVKTLHPHIHGGILADKSNPEHMETLKKLGIVPFDLVCVNLYNFAEAVKKGLSLTEAVEQIDIGGPCMLRAAAKNFNSVLVVPEVESYGLLMDEMKNNNMQVSLGTREQMAKKTFLLTSNYDAMISNYL